ncbi:MAG TPA: mechanosensitive ion channel family protein [Flavobacterium sp.]
MQHFINWANNVIPWLLDHGLRILVIIIGALILNALSGKLIKRSVRIAVVAGRFHTRESELKREDTLIRIFSWTTSIVILIVAILMILQEGGIAIAPILASVGILGVAVGFGGQYLIKDIISGFFIILENQYRIGDVVRFEEVSGTVEDISLRKTTLRDMDGIVHHVPHGEIKTVSNMSQEFSRINLNVGVSYNAQLDEVIRVIDEVGSAMFEDPKWKDTLITAPHFLRVDDFADSAVVVKIVADTQALQQWATSGELRKRLKIAFDEAGIEIPFPQRVIHQAAPLDIKKT